MKLVYMSGLIETQTEFLFRVTSAGNKSDLREIDEFRALR